MPYTSFTIKEDKRQAKYRINFTHVEGQWEGSGTFGDLFEVSGVLVLTNIGGKPVAVYNDLDSFIATMNKKHGIKPVVI